MGDIKYVKMYRGYAEDCSTTALEFLHLGGANTRFELLQALAKVLLFSFTEDWSWDRRTKKCCQEVDTPFCPVCGTRVDSDSDKAACDFYEFVRDIWQGDANSYPHALYEFGFNAWPSFKDLSALKPENVLEITSYGPEAVCLSLDPEGSVGFDELCELEKKIADITWVDDGVFCLPYWAHDGREAFIKHINDNLPE